MVSVIIPVYNSEKTISQAIFSALQQTIAPLEVIVIDDCSSDQTCNVVEQIVCSEKKVRLYKNPQNYGVAKTRNIGCCLARGRFIAFLDSDDIWDKNKLEKQLQCLELTKSDFSYTAYYIVSGKQQKLYRVPTHINYSHLLKENFIGCSTVLIRAELMNEYKFNPDFFHEDYVLWLTLLRRGFQAKGLDEPLVYYRKGGRSSFKLKAAKNRWIVYRKSEGMNFIKSFYYILCYLFRSIIKYFFIRQSGKKSEE